MHLRATIGSGTTVPDLSNPPEMPPRNTIEFGASEVIEARDARRPRGQLSIVKLNNPPLRSRKRRYTALPSSMLKSSSPFHLTT